MLKTHEIYYKRLMVLIAIRRSIKTYDLHTGAGWKSYFTDNEIKKLELKNEKTMAKQLSTDLKICDTIRIMLSHYLKYCNANIKTEEDLKRFFIAKLINKYSDLRIYIEKADDLMSIVKDAENDGLINNINKKSVR